MTASSRDRSLTVLHAPAEAAAAPAPEPAAHRGSMAQRAARRAASMPWIGRLAVAVAAFAVHLNLPAIATEFYGVPKMVAQFVVLLLLIPIALRPTPVVVTTTSLLVVLYAIAMLVAAAAARRPADTFGALESFFFEGLLLFFLFTSALREVRLVRIALTAVVLSVGVMGGVSLVQQVTGNFESQFGGLSQQEEGSRGIRVTDRSGEERIQPRLAGPVGEKNRYAQVLLCAAPIGFFLARAEARRPRRWLLLGSSVLALGGLVLTFSRGAAVAGFGVLTLMVAARYVRLRTLVGIVVVGFLAVATFVPTYLERVASVANADEVGAAGSAADGAIVGRATASLAAWHVFLDHPVVGVGPERFYHDYSREYGNELDLRFLDTPRRAHNLYLEVAADLGIVGLGAFLAMVGWTLARLDRLRRRFRHTRPDLSNLAAAPEFALIAYLFSGVFLHLAYQRYFWLLLALGAAAIWVVERAGRDSVDGGDAADTTTTASVPSPPQPASI